MSELKSSLFISFLNKYTTLIITITSSMIIARLLTPGEIGTFSVGASLIGVAHTIRDFGVSNYLIQEKQISENKIRSAFTLTALMAWTISGLLLSFRTNIADFYNNTDLCNIIIILSINFIILPFSSVSIALLKRELKFKLIYKLSIIASVSQAITTLTLATFGYSYYSLAWGGVANVASTVLLSQLANPHWSYFVPNFSNIRTVIGFGGQSSVSSLANEFGNNAPDLIIGKIMGFTAVGTYSRALGFISIIEQCFTDAIYPVLLPFFSKENRQDGDIKQPFLMIANYYLAITLPLLSLIAVLAYPMIRLLYGSQWHQSVPIAQILCFAMAFKSLNFLMGAAILSIGNAKELMKIQLLYLAIRLSAISYGTLYNLTTIATCIVAAEFIGFFIFFSKLRSIKIKLNTLLRIIIKNLFISFLTLITSLATYQFYIYNPNGINGPISNGKYLLSPTFPSDIENLYLILVTSFIALCTWLYLIKKLQNELYTLISNHLVLFYLKIKH